VNDSVGYKRKNCLPKSNFQVCYKTYNLYFATFSSELRQASLPQTSLPQSLILTLDKISLGKLARSGTRAGLHVNVINIPLLRFRHINVWFTACSHVFYRIYHIWDISEGSKSSTHYLGDKNRFDVSSKGPSSGISVKRRICFYCLGSE
jgi:hypothetical protein